MVYLGILVARRRAIRLLQWRCQAQTRKFPIALFVSLDYQIINVANVYQSTHLGIDHNRLRCQVQVNALGRSMKEPQSPRYL